MTCPNCGFQNEPGQRFCDNCGEENRSGALFCRNCGNSLGGGAEQGAATPQSALDGRTPAERRLVSVLFADIVGFTPFAEERDPEAVRELLERYFAAARTVIERHGGVVEKFIGDAVMAVWGTPVARE